MAEGGDSVQPIKNHLSPSPREGQGRFMAPKQKRGTVFLPDGVPSVKRIVVVNGTKQQWKPFALFVPSSPPSKVEEGYGKTADKEKWTSAHLKEEKSAAPSPRGVSELEGYKKPPVEDRHGNILLSDDAAVECGLKGCEATERAMKRYIELLPEATKLERKRVEEGKWRAAKSGNFKRLRARPGFKALQMMKEEKTCANVEKRVGSIPGIGVGSIFMSKCLLAAVGLHGEPWKGIDYSYFIKYGCNLAVAVVNTVDEYYDQDFGTTLVYMGSGGMKGGKLVESQKLSHGNLALVNNCKKGVPVRVIRGRREKSSVKFSYDGLYMVEAYFTEEIDDCTVFKFRLEMVEGQGKDPTPISPPPRNRLLRELYKSRMEK